MGGQNPSLDYQYYYLNNPYQLPPPHLYGYPQYYQHYFIGPPKSLQESLINTYQRGIVNNIIGAFFIKEQNEKRKNSEKRKVPISTVDFREEQNNNSGNNKSNVNKANENTGDKNKNEEKDKSSYLKDQNNKNNIDDNDEGNKEESGDDNNEKENEEKRNDEKEKEEKDNNIYEHNNISHGNELKKPDII